MRYAKKLITNTMQGRMRDAARMAILMEPGTMTEADKAAHMSKSVPILELPTHSQAIQIRNTMRDLILKTMQRTQTVLKHQRDKGSKDEVKTMEQQIDMRKHDDCDSDAYSHSDSDDSDDDDDSGSEHSTDVSEEEAHASDVDDDGKPPPSKKTKVAHV